MKRKKLQKWIASLSVLTLTITCVPLISFANEGDMVVSASNSHKNLVAYNDDIDDPDPPDDPIGPDDPPVGPDDPTIEPDDPTVGPDDPTVDPNDSSEPFEVTQDEYNNKYQNDPNYELIDTITYYSYGTKQKLTTTSGESSLSGWTWYNKTQDTAVSDYRFGTPIAASTSYANNRKTETCAVDTGWYYYAYTVADPNNTSDWCYYADKTRAKVIAHMKKNFSKSSAWDEGRLRYFWYISPKDLGATSGKLKKTIPYCASSNVSVGTLSQKATHYYDIPIFRYKQIYKVRTVTTINYFYKWSDYVWSGWSQSRQSIPADGTVIEKSEVKCVIRPVNGSNPNQDYKNIHECRLNIVSGTDFTYTGKGVHVQLELIDDGIPLVEGKDYTEIGNGRINPGTYYVTLQGIGNYYGMGNIEYTISKANPTLYYKQSSVTVIAGKAVSNEFVATKGLSVTTKSSNTKVATVNSNGTVVAKAAGSATITASIPASQCYNAKSASYTLKVVSPTQTNTVGKKTTTKEERKTPPVMPGKVKKVKIKYTYGAAKVSWKKASKATEYQVRYKSDGEKSWHCVTVKTNFSKIQGFGPGKKNTFQVRAVNRKGNSTKASSWSKKKSKKTKSNYNIVYTYNKYTWPDAYFAKGVGAPNVQYVKKGGSFKVPKGWYALRRSDGKLYNRSSGKWVSRSQALRYPPALTFAGGSNKLTKKMLKGKEKAWFELILMH